MWHIRSSSQRRITKTLTAWMLGLKSVPGERTLQKSRVNELMRKLRDGNAIPFDWISATCDGEEYRINGQHTSAMFDRYPELMAGNVARVLCYDCDTMEDVMRLWQQIDPYFSSRNRPERTKAFAEYTGEFDGVGGRQLALGMSAASIRCYGPRLFNTQPDEMKQRALKHFAPFVRWAAQMFNSVGSVLNKDIIRRTGVWYAALVSWEQNQAKATQFWNEVLGRAETTERTNPAHVLRETLLSHSTNSGAGARTGKKTLDWDQQADLSISAWKAWLAHQKIKVLRLHPNGVKDVSPTPLWKEYQREISF